MLTFTRDNLTVCIALIVYEDQLFENSSEYFIFELLSTVPEEDSLIDTSMSTTLVNILDGKSVHVFHCIHVN